jgi:hypothetical protein
MSLQINQWCDCIYEDISVRLNILTLHSRRRHIDALLNGEDESLPGYSAM